MLDVATRAPVPSSVTPFATVTLERCPDVTGSNCFAIARQPLDAEGRFRLELDDSRVHIGPGRFQLGVSSRGVLPVSGSFRRAVVVAAGENVDLGDFLFWSFATVAFDDVRPCSTLRPQGGTCRYSVRVRNMLVAPDSGTLHSTVMDMSDGTVFEADTSAAGIDVGRVPVALPANGSQDVSFSFDVPASLPSGRQLCASLRYGREPAPLFAVEINALLFCVVKSASGISPMSADDTRALLEGMPQPSAGMPPATE